MPDIKIYMDMENCIKHRNLPKDKKSEINLKAKKLIIKELDKIPDKSKR